MPLVESTNGRTVVVTFCWRDAAAAQVLLFANRLTDETNLDATMLERLGETDLWHASFEMAPDWRASYSFLVRMPGRPAPWVTDGQVGLRAALDRGLVDPLNPEVCRNRAGVEQSVVALPEAPAQPWLAVRPGVRRGTLTAVTGPAGRTVWCYAPAGQLAREPLPLVVALDGEVWAGPQSLSTTLDNLIADGEIPHVRAVLPSSGGTASRWDELGSAAGYELVVEELIPFAADRWPLARGAVIVVGQSLGGLTALRCGLLYPDVVAGAVSQSASLWLDDLGELTGGADRRSRVHLAHGSQEWVLDSPHRLLADRLRAAGVSLQTAVHNGGHDYAWWRGDVADGLRWCLAGRAAS